MNVTFQDKGGQPLTQKRTLIIGDPVAHSLSPTIHNPCYKVLNLPYSMDRLQVPLEKLDETVSTIRAEGVQGVAITMPLKVAAISLVDDLSDAAREIGAINTLYWSHDGRLIGDNTDWVGINTPLLRQRKLEGLTVAILGAGGAALAALYCCTREKARVTIFNRSEEKAKALGHRWGASVLPFSELPLLNAFDVVINATPVGMGSHGAQRQPSPFDAVTFRSQQLLFETIYSPLITPFIQRGLECGADTLTGDAMFLEQAMAQFKLHTGLDAPRDTMAGALHQALTSIATPSQS